MQAWKTLILLVLITIPIGWAFAQSTTTGDISGVVADQTGAVIPGATVAIKNQATAAVYTTKSNQEGIYRLSLIQPGAYTVNVSAKDFGAGTVNVQVAAGELSTANFKLRVMAVDTTLEVTASPLETGNADIATSYGSARIEQLPNSGNDLTAIVQTSPGIVQNTQAGGGNFSVYGLPALSNMFRLNGQNDIDPFINRNMAGATNMLLGTNELEEATVITNGYSGQYGQLAGAQVNFITKSGGNGYHGNATYYWNDQLLNANTYFNNLAGNPRPFDNASQWAASFGGPIKKDKTFFFLNYEGFRVVLPISNRVLVPNPLLEAVAIDNLNANGFAASVPFYQNIFQLYRSAPGVANAAPVSLNPNNGEIGAGCGAITALGPGVPCVLAYQSQLRSPTNEYQLSLRVDHKFNDRDSIFIRMQTNQGRQATYTDPINAAFNLATVQPEYQGQLNWTHILNTEAVNEFKMSGSSFDAIAKDANAAAAQAAFPSTLMFGDGSLTTIGGVDYAVPQGQKMIQYQFVDDLAFSRGNHTWKLGMSFWRTDVTDHDYSALSSGLLLVDSLTSFVNADYSGTALEQSFPTRLTQPIALYGLGVYGQTEWRVTRSLQLLAALRLDHNSNPVCQTDCFARLRTPFTSLLQDPNAANIPYNQAIQTGLHQAFPATDLVVWQPRIGINWSPFANGKTVLRGGFGIFADSLPAIVVDQLSSNPPANNIFVVGGAPISPVETGNLFAEAANSNAAFASSFANGATLAQLQAINGFFPPSLTATGNKVRQPRYQEWNLEVERQLPWDMVAAVNYVGNHGIFEMVGNGSLNAFANPSIFPNGFAGLPSAPPDPAFGTVTQLQSIGVSNYNGLVSSLRHAAKHGLEFQVNYTWSHALDEVSNGGVFAFNQDTTSSMISPSNAFNLRQSYGNADYDVRHSITADYAWTDSLRHIFHRGPNSVFGGWTFSGTIFRRTGFPFSVVDGSTSTLLQGIGNYGSLVLAGLAGSMPNPHCGGSATGNNGTPCLLASDFQAATGFGNQDRNQFRGPGYFNTNLSVTKGTKLTEHAELVLGCQFFNLFNHPNFDQPVNDINNPDFGRIVRTVTSNSSLLGTGLGGDASPRLIQLKAQVRF